jgi:hypothetical protein
MSDEIESAVREVFAMCASRAKLDLLFLVDAVEIEGNDVTVQLQLDVPPAIEEELSNDPLIRKPVKDFLSEIRPRFPQLRFSVSWVESDEDPEEEPNRWRRLEIALARAEALPLLEKLSRQKPAKPSRGRN